MPPSWSVNDGQALDATLAGVLDEYAQLASVACVPLGVSRYTKETAMRPHGPDEARAVVDLVHDWQETFLSALGRRMVFAADEYYLLAGRPFPPSASYEGYPQHENGIGMAAALSDAFGGDASAAIGARHGFFASVDGAPAAGYRATRHPGAGGGGDAVVGDGLVVVVTGRYGAAVLGPLLAGAGYGNVSVLAVDNEFFGGNIAVTGLIAGVDLVRALAGVPARARVLLPDVCLSEGRFIDGLTLDDLPRPVEVLPADGLALRRALDTAADRVPVPAIGERVPVAIGGRGARS